MRDEHRPKQELIHEIAGLRKQVGDLKDAMTARRRVEDALRSTQDLLRSLTDDAPVGLGLFRRDGTLLTANRPFAQLLGYDTPAELQAVGGVLGFFANAEEQSRAFGTVRLKGGGVEQASFRTKDGCRRAHAVLAAESVGQQGIVVVVLEQIPVSVSSSPDQGG